MMTEMTGSPIIGRSRIRSSARPSTTEKASVSRKAGRNGTRAAVTIDRQT